MFPAMFRITIRTERMSRTTNEGKGSGISRLDAAVVGMGVFSSIVVDRTAVIEFVHIVLVAEREGLAEVIMGTN